MVSICCASPSLESDEFQQIPGIGTRDRFMRGGLWLQSRSSGTARDPPPASSCLPSGPRPDRRGPPCARNSEPAQGLGPPTGSTGPPPGTSDSSSRSSPPPEFSDSPANRKHGRERFRLRHQRGRVSDCKSPRPRSAHWLKHRILAWNYSGNGTITACDAGAMLVQGCTCEEAATLLSGRIGTRSSAG